MWNRGQTARHAARGLALAQRENQQHKDEDRSAKAGHNGP